MQCQEASERMSLRLDGRLTRSEELVLDQHMDRCADCSLEWESLQAVSALFAAVQPIPAPSGLTQVVMVRVRRRGRTLAVVRGASLLVLASAILAAFGLLPLAAVSGVAYGSPAVLHALIRITTSVASIGSALFGGVLLVLRQVMGGPGGVAFLGCALAAGFVAWAWLRLALRPTRVGVRVRSQTR